MAAARTVTRFRVFLTCRVPQLLYPQWRHGARALCAPLADAPCTRRFLPSLPILPPPSIFSPLSLYTPMMNNNRGDGRTNTLGACPIDRSTSEAARCPDHRGTLRRDWPRCCHIHIHTCSHAVCGQVNAGRALRAITHVECVYLAYYRVPLSDNTHRGTPTSQRDSIQWNLIRALAPRCIIDLLALVK